MPARYIYIGFTCFIITIIHTGSCLEEERENFLPADIIITDNKPLKRIEVRNRSNATSTFPETPTVIQQGNNLYIKPKFIFGSPFTSYKHGNTPDGCCDNISVTSKVLDEETNIVIGKPNIPQIPSVGTPPAILRPPIGGNIIINPIRFPVPQIPNSCGPLLSPIPYEEIVIPMPCPTFVIPVFPDFSQPPRYPIFLEKPVYPVVIPKPPELPPIILPQLPIEVVIQNPIFTKPPDRVPIIVPPLCPPMVQCITPERDLPSLTDIVSVLFKKLKNLINIPNKIELSKLFTEEEKVAIPALPLAFPTLCARNIIAERVVPNIIKNDNVKIVMSPFIQSQFTTDFYRK